MRTFYTVESKRCITGPGKIASLLQELFHNCLNLRMELGGDGRNNTFHYIKEQII